MFGLLRRTCWLTLVLVVGLVSISFPATPKIVLKQGETWRVYDASSKEMARLTVDDLVEAFGVVTYHTTDLATSVEDQPIIASVAEAKAAIAEEIAKGVRANRGYFLDRAQMNFSSSETIAAADISPPKEGAKKPSEGQAAGGPAGGPPIGEGAPGGPAGAAGPPGEGGPGAGPGGPEAAGPATAEGGEAEKKGLPLIPIIIGIVVIAIIVLLVLKMRGRKAGVAPSPEEFTPPPAEGAQEQQQPPAPSPEGSEEAEQQPLGPPSEGPEEQQ